MGDVARRLDREYEIRRHLLSPAFERGWPLHAVERAIYFDRSEMAGGVSQFLLSIETLGVKYAPSGRIRPAGDADTNDAASHAGLPLMYE